MRQPHEQTILLIVGSRGFESWKGPGLVHWDNLRRVFKEMSWFMGEFFPGESPEGVFKAHYSGAASGADELGSWWAFLNGVETRLFHYRSDKGRAGGPIRNTEMIQAAINETEMASVPPCLVAFWDNESRGTADVIRKAEKADFWTHIVKI